MEILRHAVVLVHLTGFAVLFGSWVVAAFGERRITRLMNWGMLIAAVAGLVLATPLGATHELNYVKLGVKFVVLLVIAALIGIGSARQKRTGEAPAPLFWSIGALTFANAAMAVLWR